MQQKCLMQKTELNAKSRGFYDRAIFLRLCKMYDLDGNVNHNIVIISID